MRTVKEIIIHCSATPEGSNFTTKDINTWHIKRGFKKIGYHYIIYLDGSIHMGRPETEIGAHCINHNRNSIGICYIGGLDRDGKPKDTRTSAQKNSLNTLLGLLTKKYPSAKICGHNEFAAKDCPCFDVQAEYNHLGSFPRN